MRLFKESSSVMLLKMDGGGPSTGTGRANNKPQGILDSPTLARVERAMLRHEEGAHREAAHLQRAAYTQVSVFNKRFYLKKKVKKLDMFIKYRVRITDL